MVIRNVERPVGEIKVGGTVTLRRPATDDGLAEAPGWHPWLDRLNGQRVTVRTVALAATGSDNFGLVLVHETPFPIRSSWLSEVI